MIHACPVQLTGTTETERRTRAKRRSLAVLIATGGGKITDLAFIEQSIRIITIIPAKPNLPYKLIVVFPLLPPLIMWLGGLQENLFYLI